MRGAVSQLTSSLTPGGAGGAHDSLSPRLLCQPVTSPELQAPARPTQATSPNQYFRLGPHSHAQESRCQVRPLAVTTALLSPRAAVHAGYTLSSSPQALKTAAPSSLISPERACDRPRPSPAAGARCPLRGTGLSGQSAVPQNQQQARGPSSEPSTARRWPRKSAGSQAVCCWPWGCIPAAATTRLCDLCRPFPCLAVHSRAHISNQRVLCAPVPLSGTGQGWTGCRQERNVSLCARHTGHWPPLR